MKTTPLGNNCLIEVIRDNEAVSRMDDNEDMSYGKLIDFNIEAYHLTASAALQFDPETMAAKDLQLNKAIGKTVRWEQYAEGGQTFEETVGFTSEDGEITKINKTFALIPWWRLISVTEE